MIYRDEYPRPDFVRKRWMTLNGTWGFEFDDENVGLKEKWYDRSLAREIVVPFAYQTKLSGIHSEELHPIIWYQKEFELDPSWEHSAVLLNFGAVDYFSTIWINGCLAGQNKGGYIAFSLDITQFLQQGTNVITVRVEDHPVTSQPRGKQRARHENFACWYTPISGIWQSVWLEATGETYLERVKLEPVIEESAVKVEYLLNRFAPNLRLQCTVSLGGELVFENSTPLVEAYNRFSDLVPEREGRLTLQIPYAQLWSPESPVLYDLNFKLVREDDSIVDEVATYVGMRKVSVKDGKFYLNNKPYFLRMVLDQGYWLDGVYTAPSVEAIKKDVEMTKLFGFNTARKHQKFEDPYYYYYCDQLGLLTWCEMAACYYYSEEVSKNITDEWQRLVIRHYNHPSVVAWVPINESWGVDQLTRHANDPRLVSHLQAMYHLTKSLDPTRLVVGNDGWQHADTDLIAIHEYTQNAADFARRYARFRENPHSPAFSHGHPIMLEGFELGDRPIMVTEFGGVKIRDNKEDSWGYGHEAEDIEDMLKRIRELVDTIISFGVAGYCYTQLTDVQQEVNGLMTMARVSKADPERYREIFKGR